MIHGLQAIHDMNIVHRDIKSANVFMTRSGVVKLGDLNVSKVAIDTLLQTQTGTPYYASPEVWKEMPYNHKSDIWSVGCVLYEMCQLHPPFMASEMRSLYKKVMEGKVFDLPKMYSHNLRSVIKKCLH